MNYERTRILVNDAIDAVDRRLASREDPGASEIGWCQLDMLKFDQTFCDDGDERDNTMVIVSFRWSDDITRLANPNGLEDEVLLDSDDMVSSYFVAGLIYAKILMKEKLFH